MTVDIAQWSVETVRRNGAMPGLQAEWDDLYQRCSRATPFQSHPWLDSWWRGYGRPGGLVLVLVRRRGQLVAAVALAQARHLPGVLTFAGAGVSDYGDVLLDDGDAGEAAGRLAAQLAALARWGVLDLTEVRPTAALWRVVAAWPGRSWRLPASTCLELPGLPLDELLAELPPRTARRRRREVRRIEAAGVKSERAAPAQVAQVVRELLVLHRRQWRGRAMTPEHGLARFAEHLSRSLTAMVARGEAELTRFLIDGRLLAVQVLLVGRDMVGAYLYGVEPELRKKIDVVSLMLNEHVAEAVRLGRPTVSLLRGDEPSKRRWQPRQVPNQRVLLAGPGRVLPPYVAAVRARAAVVPFVKEHLPFVRPAARRVRAWFASCT